MPCHLIATAARAASRHVEVAYLQTPSVQAVLHATVVVNGKVGDKGFPAQVETWGKAGQYLMGFSSHRVTSAQHTAVLHPLQSSSTATLCPQTGFCLFACSCGLLQLQGGGCSNPPKRRLSGGA